MKRSDIIDKLEYRYDFYTDGSFVDIGNILDDLEELGVLKQLEPEEE